MRLDLHPYGAGAGLAHVATELGPAGLENVAQIFEDPQAVDERGFATAAVDVYGEGSSWPQTAFGRRSRTRTALPIERGISPGLLTVTSALTPIIDLM